MMLHRFICFGGAIFEAAERRVKPVEREVILCILICVMVLPCKLDKLLAQLIICIFKDVLCLLNTTT